MNRLYLFAAVALLLPLSCQKETDIVLENASGQATERITTFYASGKFARARPPKAVMA